MGRRNSSKSREDILVAAENFMKERGAGTLTVEAVAKAAGCAKGLVHYHFKTKRRLVESVADRVAEARQTRWSEAFQAPSPGEAIDATWSVLAEESADGTLRAWWSWLAGDTELTESTVKTLNERFATTVRDAAMEMLAASGLMPSISPQEMGWYLGSVIHGMGFQLCSGLRETELEGAYAAAWAGILSLTVPSPLVRTGGRGDGDGGVRLAAPVGSG